MTLFEIDEGPTLYIAILQRFWALFDVLEDLHVGRALLRASGKLIEIFPVN